MYVVFVIPSIFGKTTAAPNFGKCNIVLFPEKDKKILFPFPTLAVWGESTFSHNFSGSGLFLLLPAEDEFEKQ